MRNHLTWFVLLLLLLPATAAAAEGGWYLMLPPVEKGKSVFDRPKVDRNAPMTQWRQKEAFDSAEECRTGREIQRDSYNRMADIAWNNTPYMKTGDKDYRHTSGQLYLGYIAEAYRYANALCIASNDPRLAPPR
jgi:predicted small lipoprotein YifL